MRDLDQSNTEDMPSLPPDLRFVHDAFGIRWLVPYSKFRSLPCLATL